ncbi:MAG: lytic transglycosylase domain-containing protein [Candidatus Binataceae bacterium]
MKLKPLKALLFAVVMLAAAARGVSAQWVDGGPPVLDTHRLYQIVGYLYNLDPDLLAAIATAESNGNPSAVSPKGAQGLMQLMPGTAHRYRVNNPFDPVENVLGAARFLTQLRSWSQMQTPTYEVDLPAMIAAYNAGPGAVEKYGGIPPYAETQAYVRKVLWLYLLGQPPPHRLNPVRASKTTTRAARLAPATEVSAPRYAVAPAPQYVAAAEPRAAHRDSDSSVFAQLAEIKRKRRQAMVHDTETRAALHIQ